MSEKDVIKETRQRMDAVIDDFRRKIATVRTGRAAVSLLDSVMVDYYGTMTPLNQMASVHAPEPQMLTVQPWDQTQVAPIEKAIRSADLGLNPSNDGKLVRIPIPPLTEERRKQLAKQLHDVAEDHRTAVRNIRRDGNERLKKMLKDKQISEDAERDALEEIQKLHQHLHQQDRRSPEEQRTRDHQRLNSVYDSMVSSRSRKEILADPGTLNVLHDLPNDFVMSNEGPETWSPYDVVGHLIEGEETGLDSARADHPRTGRSAAVRPSIGSRCLRSPREVVTGIAGAVRRVTGESCVSWTS